MGLWLLRGEVLEDAQGRGHRDAARRRRRHAADLTVAVRRAQRLALLGGVAGQILQRHQARGAAAGGFGRRATMSRAMSPV